MGYAHAAPGARLKDGDQIIVPYVLIGMVLGAAYGQYPADFEQAPARDSEFNSGISVVQPVKEIIEFLHSPMLVEERMRAVEEIRKMSGYPARIIRKYIACASLTAVVCYAVPALPLVLIAAPL